MSLSFLTVKANASEQRIDNYLLRFCKHVPKMALYKMMRRGEIRVNKGRIKPSHRLQIGDEIRLPPMLVQELLSLERKDEQLPSAPSGLIQKVSDSVIYENDQLIICDKPSGIAVHGGSAQPFGLIELIKQNIAARADWDLAHRIDRDTSGILMLGKKRTVLKALHDAFRESMIEKQYICIVIGHWPKRKTVVKLPLYKNLNRHDHAVTVCHERGKNSETHFNVLKHFKRYGVNMTLLEVIPKTGRTHQIRVHTQASGFPILGDVRYGDKKIDQQILKHAPKRLYLHAKRLIIPETVLGERFEFCAALPKAFHYFQTPCEK